MQIDKETACMPTKIKDVVLSNPFIVASGPASRTVEQIVEAEENGWGGISIKLTFEPEPYISRNPRYRWLKDYGYHIFTLEKRLNMNEGIKLVKEARKKTKDIVIFANIAYCGENGNAGWGEMAKKFEDIGAHIIELNFCCPNMSFNLDLNQVEKSGRHLSGASLGSVPEIVSVITSAVRNAVKIPIVTKLTPEGGRIGEVAKAAILSGADAVSGTANRLGIPPIDIYNPENVIYRLQKGYSLGCLSGPWIRTLALRDVFEMRNAIGKEPIIIGTGGIENYRDAVEMCMLGADFIGICTAVMLKGFGILPRIMKDLRKYLNDMSKEKFSDLRDMALPQFKSAQNLVSLQGYANVDLKKCTGCKKCANISHCSAISIVNKKAQINIESCLGCSTCVDICTQGAIKMKEV
ncbi:MAG: hypothetical protein COY53_01430 [Elusimicrobia bacterium CG_4_10_14_0_8_um_filter_37_32]|nr:MAG: hypothetical protein COY53_01430 [Elusimicrobia bacterium CG_4_10_14_0_8_um_filter_37_32]